MRVASSICLIRPGHEDFSEDTYRTLSAVDAAVMVIDAAKGIEARTRKLFEVCRLRDIPIVTFINKLDREARDPFELLDEIEKTLALDAAPITWPLSRGKTFAGTYRFATKSVRKLDKDDEELKVSGLDDEKLAALLPPLRGRRLARGGGARRGGQQALRPQNLPRGASHARLLRQRAA